MATLKITLSEEVLDAPKQNRSVTIAIESRGRRSTASGTRTRGKSAEEKNFRVGSLPDRLLKWAAGRRRPFGVPDVMKQLNVRRAHAPMVLTKAVGSGRLRRVARGAYTSA